MVSCNKQQVLRAYSTGPTASSGRKTGKGRPRLQENKIAGAAVILKLFNSTKKAFSKEVQLGPTFLFLISLVYSTVLLAAVYY